MHDIATRLKMSLAAKAVLFGVSLLLLEGCRPSRVPSAYSRPNMVVILVDDMRWDEYAAAGHTYIKTPHIDRLVKEGITFKNAFCTTPLCSPSRASFLTGQYAHTNGIIDNLARDTQSHKLVTFPKMLHDAGYLTGFIGKWHMGNDNTRRPGWDYWASLKGQGEAENPNLNINGTEQQLQGYVTDILMDQALKFIRASNDKPFLLYLSHKALHPNVVQRNDGSVGDIGQGGFVPAPRHKGMYDSSVFDRRANYAIIPTDKPALLRQIDSLPPLGIATATKEKTIQERAEMLMAVDEGVGSLLKVLEDQGTLDQTVIVFTSDHGFFYGEHGLDEERRLAYEESIRIPMIIRYPPIIKAASQSDHMILSVDIAPTLLAIARVQSESVMHGKSFLPLFNNVVNEWRTTILLEYYSDRVFPRIRNMGYKAVRTDRYKFIHYLELVGMDELYDLQHDPFELKNLFNDIASHSILMEMQDKLNEQLILTQ